MSWWNSIHDLTGDISKGAEAVGKVGKNVGHAIAPVVKNPLVDAALAAGGQLIGIPAPLTYGGLQAAGTAMTPGQNIGGALKAGAIGGGEAYLGGKVLGMLPGMPGGGGGGAAPPASPDLMAAGDLMNAGPLPGATDMGAGGMAGIPAGGAPAGPTAPSGGGIPWGTIGQDALKYGLPALQAVNAATLGKKATDYAKNALGTQTALFNSTAPLRNAGITNLTNLTQGNPWAKGSAAPPAQPVSRWG